VALKISNQSGQSLIESLAFSVALFALLSALGALLYFGLVHMGMNYLLHEFLVCQSMRGASQCREEFYKKSKPFLFAAKIQIFESSSYSTKQAARLVLQMPLKRTLTLKKDLGIYR
jgi:hypothetical protein